MIIASKWVLQVKEIKIKLETFMGQIKNQISLCTKKLKEIWNIKIHSEIFFQRNFGFPKITLKFSKLLNKSQWTKKL